MGTYRRGDEVWSIERDDTRITIVEGGVTRVENLPSAAIARTRFNVLTNQKARDGWRLVVEQETEPAPRLAVVHGAREPHLEAAILEDPDNDEAWFVYGDWLMQQGDPRGSQIALRRASRAAPDDHLARERLRRFEAYHASYLNGGVRYGKLGWGFLDEIMIANLEECEIAMRDDAARFVRRIELLYEATGDREAIFALLEAKAPSTLRELVVEGSHPVESFAMPAVLARLRVLELASGASRLAIDELAGARQLVVLGIAGDVDVVQLASSPVAAQLKRLFLGGISELDAHDLADRIAKFPALRSIGVPDNVDAEGMRRLEYAIGVIEDLPGRYITINE